MEDAVNGAVERAGPRRSPSGGGYARGDETRSRIVAAALSRFAADGYDRASTRRIARDAGVNPPALQYYFSGKDGLHMACAQELMARFALAMAPGYAAADAVAPGDADAAVEAMVTLIDAVMDALFERHAEADATRFMARGQGEEGTLPAYGWMRELTGRELHGRARRLVALATGADEDDPVLPVRTLAILAPIKAFHVGRTDVANRLCWPDLLGERLQLIKRVIGEQTRAVLLAARRGGAG
ncbi:MAG: CerR family C-terminal domain-containing protein [Gluconacetobacter diazotrophicus]|nr:CerR family C-terminal domain-containing protein [Gluconacetobacter diazotrophicus]